MDDPPTRRKTQIDRRDRGTHLVDVDDLGDSNRPCPIPRFDAAPVVKAIRVAIKPVSVRRPRVRDVVAVCSPHVPVQHCQSALLFVRLTAGDVMHVADQLLEDALWREFEALLANDFEVQRLQFLDGHDALLAIYVGAVGRLLVGIPHLCQRILGFARSLEGRLAGAPHGFEVGPADLEPDFPVRVKQVHRFVVVLDAFRVLLTQRLGACQAILVHLDPHHGQVAAQEYRGQGFVFLVRVGNPPGLFAILVWDLPCDSVLPFSVRQRTQVAAAVLLEGEVVFFGFRHAHRIVTKVIRDVVVNLIPVGVDVVEVRIEQIEHAAANRVARLEVPINWFGMNVKTIVWQHAKEFRPLCVFEHDAAISCPW